MTTWEYAVASRVNARWLVNPPGIVDLLPSSTVDEVMNKLGQKGWELVSATDTVNEMDVSRQLYFKRQAG